MVSNSIPGEFVLRSNVLNGRPAYENTARGLYFYYFVDSNGQFWIVGTKLGAAVGLVVNTDRATNPRLITGRWLTLQGGHWVVDRDVQLQCM